MGSAEDKDNPHHIFAFLDTTPHPPPMPTQHQLPSTNGSNQECQRGVLSTLLDTLSETASELYNAHQT